MAAADHESCRLLITAGPTREPIDAVRFIGNRSSGRMGLALTRAALARGYPTTLLLGPTELPPPEPPADGPPLNVERFVTTADLQDALVRHWPDHDVLIMAAAVADYRPVGGGRPGSGAEGKIPRGADGMTIDLEPTADLVAAAAARARADQTIIGFALEEAEGLDDAARRKLVRKGLHAIVANPLGTMESGRVAAVLHLASGETLAPDADITKEDFASWLLDRLEVVRSP